MGKFIIWHFLRRISIGFSALLVAAFSLAETRNWREPNSGIEFVRIETGCFKMGQNKAEEAVPGEVPLPPRIDELPQHEVCIDGFWMGKYEVTRAQWQRVMGGKTIQAENTQHPIANVTWEAAQGFIQRLNEISGDSKMGQQHYRLPTEAEWEYACLAGEAPNIIKYFNHEDLDRLMLAAWFREPMRWGPQSRPVGELAANKWGLYDMRGNVWEWTADEYIETGYRSHSPSNPQVNQGGHQRVIRGGSYKSDRYQVRCGARNYGVPDDPLPTLGLRVVKQDGDRQ